MSNLFSTFNIDVATNKIQVTNKYKYFRKQFWVNVHQHIELPILFHWQDAADLSVCDGILQPS